MLRETCNKPCSLQNSGKDKVETIKDSFLKEISLACEPGLRDKRVLNHRLEPASCVYWKLVFRKVIEYIFKESVS